MIRLVEGVAEDLYTVREPVADWPPLAGPWLLLLTPGGGTALSPGIEGLNTVTVYCVGHLVPGSFVHLTCALLQRGNQGSNSLGKIKTVW